MFRTFLTFCLFLNLISNLQAQSKQVQTSKPIILPGTNFSIVPPNSSYLPSKDFMGLFSNKYQSAIKVAELPFSIEVMKKSYQKNNNTLSFDSVFKRGTIELMLIKENNYNNQFSNDFTTLWTLIYSKDSTCIIVAANLSQELDNSLSNDIKQSLLSFRIDENIKANPLDQLSFTLNTMHSPLKFASIVMETGAYFNTSGELLSSIKDSLSYLVMVIPSYIEKNKQKKFALTSVQRRLNSGAEKIISTKNIYQSNLSGIEITTDLKKDGFQYDVYLFDSTRYYAIHAVSKSNNLDHIQLFKKITSTFKLKK